MTEAKYFQKHERNPYGDLFWNIPETKKGTVNVVGGNGQSFQTVVRAAEFLASHYPVETVTVVLPESLRSKVPKLPNFRFLPATETGSLSGEGLGEALDEADYNLLIGDLSKNKRTGQKVVETLGTVRKPVLVTRDAVDVVAEENPERVLLNGAVNFLATAQQLQKLLRAVYYPKMMTLSMSLLQVAEVLHKFTVSYEVGVVTFYSEQVLVAKVGKVEAVALEDSGFSPMTLWGGQLADKIVALNLYNPRKFVEASVGAIFHKL